MKRLIEVRLTKEGIHKFARAEGEEAYLQHLHRHLFYIYVQIEVYHNDRDLEFFAFKRDLQKVINEFFGPRNNIEGQSCEDINEHIYKWIREFFPHRSLEIRTYEDNENGAVLID